MTEELANNAAIDNTQLVSFIRRLFPRLNNEYKFFDYTSIKPKTWEYHDFVDLIFEKNQENPPNDEETRLDRFQRLILSLPYEYSVMNFFLSMPNIIYKIEEVSKLRFNAKASTTSDKAAVGKKLKSFGRHLQLGVTFDAILPILDDDIMTVLNEAITTNERRLKKILELYTSEYTVEENSLEALASDLFNSVLKFICSFLCLKSEVGSQIRIDESPLVPPGSQNFQSIYPDIVVKQGVRKICVIEMKTPTLFYKKERSSLSFHSLCSDRMKNILIQLQANMIAARTKFGILSDGYYLIVLEFHRVPEKFEPRGEPKYKKNKTLDYNVKLEDEESLVFPFRTRIVDVHSSCPTFFEMLIYILYKASIEETSDFYNDELPIPVVLKDKNEGPNSKKRSGKGQDGGSKRRNIRSASRAQKDDPGNDKQERRHIFLSYTTNGVLLQEPVDHITAVYKIKAKYVKGVLKEDIDDDDFVAVKIFDPLLYYDPVEEINTPFNQEEVKLAYADEIKATRMAFEAEGYNNVYLKHEEVEITYLVGYGPHVTGPAIISRYVESKEVPKTPEVYAEAKSQLQALHRAGIIHGDVKERNMLYDDKLYLFDLSHASCIDEIGAEAEKGKNRDFRMLKKVFSGEEDESEDEEDLDFFGDISDLLSGTGDEFKGEDDLNVLSSEEDDEEGIKGSDIGEVTRVSNAAEVTNATEASNVTEASNITEPSNTTEPSNVTETSNTTEVKSVTVAGKAADAANVTAGSNKFSNSGESLADEVSSSTTSILDESEEK